MTRPTPVLDQLNLVVANMDATVAFYTRLGLTIPDTTPEWQQHHRSAVLPGGVTLDFDSQAFARVWNRGWQPGQKRAMGVLGFRVPSRERVDELYAELMAAGYAGQQPPYDAFWGARYAIVSDPDGYAVGLMSPVDAARRTSVTLP
jgi:catechol 2,3-dioxygenase-like lactoylglutathione lyase family enzyme